MPTTTKPNELALAFQKWLKAKYPNVDLGKYGVNKDGIDGKIGDLTQKAFKQYGAEFKKDTGVDITPLASASAQKLSTTPSDISGVLKGMDKPKVSAIDNLLQERSAEDTANRMGKDFADGQNLKTQGISDLAAPAIGGLYGISQMIKGKKLSKDLKPPKTVAPLNPNQQLSSLLAQVGVNANMADPKIREQALRDITTNREMANEIARVGSAGDITSFSQNAQNNYLRSNDAVRKLASDETADIYKNRAMYGNLINQKMQEDRMNQNEKINQFNNVDLPEFQKARQYAADLSNQGMNNMFGAVNNVTRNAVPILGGYNNIMSGYKARYLSMSPEEKKAFAMKYPKLAGKYEVEISTPQVTEQITEQVVPTQQIPLPVTNELAYNWRKF